MSSIGPNTKVDCEWRLAGWVWIRNDGFYIFVITSDFYFTKMFWVSLLVLIDIWVSQRLALGIILAYHILSLKNVILLQKFKYRLYVGDFQIHILSQNLFSELKTWISKWLLAIFNLKSTRDQNSGIKVYITQIMIFFTKLFHTSCLTHQVLPLFIQVGSLIIELSMSPHFI